MSTRGCRKRRRNTNTLMGTGLLISSIFLPYAAAAECIPLNNSSTCSAFKQSKISTSSALTSQYPFLEFVSNSTDFDTKFAEYITEEYVTFKYRSLFGCGNVTLPDTTGFYARFTKTVLCSRMIQDSRSDCGMTDLTATPVCADTCAQFARSEQMIVSNNATCLHPRNDAIGIIRSDFTICSNPSNSLDESCIQGSDNEIDNCGFSKNLLGLCMYCADNSPNSTDTCCYNANAQQRCVGLQLPTFTNLPPITTATSSPTASSSSSPKSEESSKGLSGGAIAGITIGSLAVVALVVVALLFCWRRKRYGNQASIFNHPTRSPPSMTFTTVGPVQSGRGYEALAGGRVARMSALEETTSQVSASSPAPHTSRAIIGNSSSSDFGPEDSPNSQKKHSPQHKPLNPPPRGRNASLSSSSALGSASDPISPMTSSEKDGSAREVSSPQSEQLPYFKDYYSSDDIHPGDKVSTLWAYSPRAPDEFELERGDMLKVVGIWDDGWATGIFLRDRAEDFTRRREMRDSGVSASQSSHHRAPSSPSADGEVKAFPLVCVCLPEHWQKTIESEGQQIPEYDSQSDGSDPGRLQTEDSAGRRIDKKSSSRFKDDLNVPRSPPSSPPRSASP
ncbi:hypothetical protein BDD12DRAFT_722282 [Trichophaea hybrida]|nr:hypothetical protein BDD12DRAFT_722282 [Trichophaea hybrida]